MRKLTFAPLFVAMVVVVEKADHGLKARIYPVSQNISTVFYDRDDENSSTITVERPDWENVVVTDASDGKQVTGEWVRHAYEFHLQAGHNYTVK